MKRALILLATHAIVGFAGFALGIYLLPILTAPPPPNAAAIEAAAKEALFKGNFRRDLKDSDAFHWGEGTIFVGRKSVALQGKVAPGPDYKMYLSPEFLETEADFARVKPKMVRIGEVKTFENFIVQVPESVDTAAYNTVIVWCESFSQFISAAKYR